MVEDTATETTEKEDETAAGPSLLAHGAKDTGDAPETDEDVCVYEVGYHVVPTEGEENVPAITAALRAAIEKEGGTFVSEETPKRMTLAYGISASLEGKKQKYTESYFGWIKFTAPRAAVAAVRASFNANGKLFRTRFFKTVREDTRAPKRSVSETPSRSPRVSLEPLAIERRMPAAVEKKAKTLTDEEIDKTIEELIAS